MLDAFTYLSCISAFSDFSHCSVHWRTHRHCVSIFYFNSTHRTNIRTSNNPGILNATPTSLNKSMFRQTNDILILQGVFGFAVVVDVEVVVAVVVVEAVVVEVVAVVVDAVVDAVVVDVVVVDVVVVEGVVVEIVTN